jgi:hypothetical protein
VHICLAPTTGVRSAGIFGEGVAAPQAEELNEARVDHQLFLPITLSE